MTPDELVRRSAAEAASINARSARLSLEIERQFGTGTATPLLFIMASAANAATEAFVSLATVAPTDVEAIRALQFEIQRYGETATWLNNAVQVGAEAFKALPSDLFDGFQQTFSASDEDN